MPKSVAKNPPIAYSAAVASGAVNRALHSAMVGLARLIGSV